jgi:hypothetical protein
MSHGPYDPATQWLLDQMHDPKMPLWRRIDIAKFLIEKYPHEFNVNWARDPVTEEPITIKVIIGGMGDDTGVASVTPERLGERRCGARLN